MAIKKTTPKSNRGAKGKYTPEVVNRICHALAATGRDKAALAAGGIHADTFYRWIKDKPEFSERVDTARAEWLTRDDYARDKAMRDGLLISLTGFNKITENEETTTLPNGDKVTKVSRQSTFVAPARWAHELVARAMNEKHGLERLTVTLERIGDVSKLSDAELSQLAQSVGIGVADAGAEKARAIN